MKSKSQVENTTLQFPTRGRPYLVSGDYMIYVSSNVEQTIRYATQRVGQNHALSFRFYNQGNLVSEIRWNRKLKAVVMEPVVTQEWTIPLGEI